MRRTWIVKLGAPIIALGLMSACGTANDNAPQDTNNTPQNQVPDNENDQDMRNNNNMNAPDDNTKRDRTREPTINNDNDKGNGPENGTEPTRHFDN